MSAPANRWLVLVGCCAGEPRGPDPQAAADAIAAGFAVSTAAFAVALLVAIRLLARDRVAADPAVASEGVA